MEIAIRAIVVFVIIWLVIRVTGKRQISQLSAFELILLVVLGDLIAQGVLEEDTSITGAAIAVCVFALMSSALAWLSYRFTATRPALQGLPAIVVHQGRVIEKQLELEGLPLFELHEAAREKGIRDLADVEVAVLEPDGKFSFFTYPAGDGGSGDSGEPSDEDAANDETGSQQGF
jgi:uncharacterized membrane protein YcaP (DUF421 family)